jgi:hypothetical protein
MPNSNCLGAETIQAPPARAREAITQPASQICEAPPARAAGRDGEFPHRCGDSPACAGARGDATNSNCLGAETQRCENGRHWAARPVCAQKSRHQFLAVLVGVLLSSCHCANQPFTPFGLPGGLGFLPFSGPLVSLLVSGPSGFAAASAASRSFRRNSASLCAKRWRTIWRSGGDEEPIGADRLLCAHRSVSVCTFVRSAAKDAAPR